MMPDLTLFPGDLIAWHTIELDSDDRRTLLGAGTIVAIDDSGSFTVFWTFNLNPPFNGPIRTYPGSYITCEGRARRLVLIHRPTESGDQRSPS